MTEKRVARAALDRALEEREDLLLAYQPIHEARSGKIDGAEALLRQRRQSGDIREASIITETAEEGPEVFLLTSLTMRRAFEEAAQWMQLIDRVRLNVNLSPREFQENDIVGKLKRLLSDCAMDATRLSLEITETSYIDRPETTLRVLNALKDLGVQLWLDDFGTGHSSVMHLYRFPIDGLKIPRPFVRGLPDETRSRAITAHLIGMAHDLGLRVIAEGIENRQQLDFLLGLECDYVQGFLFSRPMSLAQFESLLRAS